MFGLGLCERLVAFFHLAQVKKEFALIFRCRHFHQSPVANDVILNFRTNPVNGKRHEPNALVRIKMFDGFHQTDIAFLNEVGMWESVP